MTWRFNFNFSASTIRVLVCMEQFVEYLASTYLTWLKLQYKKYIDLLQQYYI